MQPIHMAIFGPLSEPWRQAVSDSSLDCGMSKSLSRDSFSELLNKTLVCTLEPELFKEAFRTCSLSPFGQITEFDHRIKENLSITDFNGIDQKQLKTNTSTKMAKEVLKAVEDLIDKDKLLNFYRHGNKAWPNDCSKDLYYVWKALRDMKVLEEEIEEDVEDATMDEFNEDDYKKQNDSCGQSFKDEPEEDYYLGVDSIPELCQ